MKTVHTSLQHLLFTLLSPKPSLLFAKWTSNLRISALGHSLKTTRLSFNPTHTIFCAVLNETRCLLISFSCRLLWCDRTILRDSHMWHFCISAQTGLRSPEGVKEDGNHGERARIQYEDLSKPGTRLPLSPSRISLSQRANYISIIINVSLKWLCRCNFSCSRILNYINDVLVSYLKLLPLLIRPRAVCKGQKISNYTYPEAPVCLNIDKHL